MFWNPLSACSDPSDFLSRHGTELIPSSETWGYHIGHLADIVKANLVLCVALPICERGRYISLFQGTVDQKRITSRKGGMIELILLSSHSPLSAHLALLSEMQQKRNYLKICENNYDFVLTWLL